MPFIGKNPTAGFSTIVKDDLTADGSTTAFTLSKNVASANDIAVFVGNVRQEPTDAYSVSGTTLTMTAAPSSGVNFYVLHIAGTLESSVVPAAGTTVPGNFGVSGDLTVDTNAFHVNATNDHIGFGTTSPATTNGAVTKVIGAKSSQNNILSGETGGIGYSGWIIEARQTGRTGQARFSQIILNTDGSDNGQMLFQNAASGGDVTESIRVSSSGLSFDSGSNYLNDYEEGTFTPTMYGSSGGTPVNGSGFYTKIGNIVKTTIVFASVNMSTGGHSGALRVGGLPFASANQQEVAAAPMTSNVAITGTDKYNMGFISDNSTLITYYRIRDLNTWTGTPVPTGSSVYLYSTFTYTTSA